eukprot:jgi/Picsp_1/4231/NSC_01740-R1_hypothetical protein CHLNCDRAFT_134746 [Chlorella variabilis]
MSEYKDDDDEPSTAALAELPTSTAWMTLEELKFDAEESPDLKIKNDMIINNEFNVVKPPPLITWERAKGLLVGVVALLSASMVLVAAFVAGYLLLTNLLSPAKLHYYMPLPLDLEGHDLVSNVTFLSLDQYNADGYVWNADDIGDALISPLLGQGGKIDAWLEISVPNEYERRHPERKFAHVTAELLSYQGKRVKRASKPVMLNGRPSSALSLALGPWRWLGVVDRRHIVPVKLFEGHVEQRNLPTVFVSVKVQARSPPGPEILEVKLHVALRSGIVRKLLFYARPQSFVGKAVGLGAFLVISSGSLVLFLCLHFYFKAAQDDVRRDQEASSTTSEGSSSLLNLSLDTPRDKSMTESEPSIGEDVEESGQTDTEIMPQPEASIRRRKT